MERSPKTKLEKLYSLLYPYERDTNPPDIREKVVVELNKLCGEETKVHLVIIARAMGLNVEPDSTVAELCRDLREIVRAVPLDVGYQQPQQPLPVLPMVIERRIANARQRGMVIDISNMRPDFTNMRMIRPPVPGSRLQRDPNNPDFPVVSRDPSKFAMLYTYAPSH